MWSKITPLWIDLLDYCMTEPFMNHLLICAIQTTLSSCNLVALPLMEGSPHVSWICSIIDLNHTHSLLASWIASIFLMIWWCDHHYLFDRSSWNSSTIVIKHIPCLWPTFMWIWKISYICISKQLLFWFPWVK